MFISCSYLWSTSVSEEYAASVFKVELCRFKCKLTCGGKLKDGGGGGNRVTSSEPVGRIGRSSRCIFHIGSLCQVGCGITKSMDLLLFLRAKKNALEMEKKKRRPLGHHSFTSLVGNFNREWGKYCPWQILPVFVYIGAASISAQDSWPLCDLHFELCLVW
jgi:hypothetical protein